MIAGAPADPGYRLKRWTLEEYHRFVEIGAIGPEARVEFVDGEIVEKMGSRPTHSNTVAQIGALLTVLFGAEHHVREEKPVTFAASEPEPDIAVIRGSRRGFFARHPSPKELALLAEVSDTTLSYDLGRKASVYAREGIQEYWVIDLNARRVVVHRNPLPDGRWADTMAYLSDMRIRPLNAEQELAVADLLPPESPVTA